MDIHKGISRRERDVSIDFNFYINGTWKREADLLLINVGQAIPPKSSLELKVKREYFIFTDI